MQAGLTIRSCEKAQLATAPPFVRPLISGAAIENT
jgi:hypothetical protein